MSPTARPLFPGVDLDHRGIDTISSCNGVRPAKIEGARARTEPAVCQRWFQQIAIISLNSNNQLHL
jgi:hypothetical protein